MTFVEYENKGDHVVLITMNRPERLNAMGYDLLEELAQSWQRFSSDNDAWVAILTGVGRSFCVGMDVKERIESGLKGVGLPTTPTFDPFWSQAGVVEKPTITAVNGLAFGGGFFLAVRSPDLCIAAESARFQISEIQRGAAAGWDFVYQAGLPRAVANDLALGGTLTAAEAYNAGLINGVVPDDQLIDAALDRANAMLQIPPLVLRANLKLVRALKPAIPEDVREMAQQIRAGLLDSPDSAEAIRSFAEKRAPVFRGL